MKRYLITAGVLLVGASLYATWRANCHDVCNIQTIVFGLPVFLSTPFIIGTGQEPGFWLVPLLINIVWSAAASVSFWSVIETFERWQDRKQKPPLP